ncbi:hypothetical protein [Nocardia sp. XZ_19_385]|uniref:hypothetical protein n=1 Tax=Nocardia sp. XZ_19_385 TaxID=2769488 RepID=UPI00188ED197|nr:hypothetical protein [Nocardia sp. XZ_19_385]
MVDFTVDVSGLAGFKLDLQDLGTNFTTNTSRLLPGVALPAGTAGLLATLAPSIEKLTTAITSAHQKDLSALGTLGDNLATASTKYQATDDNSAKQLSQAAATGLGDTGGSGTGNAEGVKRFSGLQLPTLPDVQEEQYATRQVVTAGITSISKYDEALSQAIGIKPAADYLAPLEADWEALQAIGKRIGLLGINDFVASENLTGGTRWLQSLWSGEAATAFGTSATSLGQSIAGRSTDLETISKIVENGGTVLDRLVFNQTMGLVSGLAQPMTFLNFTLPLGEWAQLINDPMRESIRSGITAAVDALKKAAESRKGALTTMLERISKALDYTPGQSVPAYNASEFEVPDKVVVDVGALRYGYGNNIWWESSIASAG